MSNALRLSFDSRPDHLVPDFIEHLKRTGEPHTWRYHTHTAPPKEGVVVLLPNFSIPRGIKARAPCPICSPKSPKYLKGHLIWSPADGTLHAVGHCCGHGFFADGRFRVSLRDAEQTIHRRELEAFLWANWEAPRQLVQLASDLAAQCRSYDKVARGIKSALTHRLCRTICAMVSKVGYLEIEEELGRRDTSGLRSVTRPYGSTPFKGSKVLKVARSDSLEARVASSVVLFDHLAWSNEDDAIMWLCSRPFEDLRLLSQRIRAAVDTLDGAKESLLALQELLSPENLALLNGWSLEAHGRASVRVFVHADESLAIWRGGEKVRQMHLPTNIWERPASPNRLLPPKESPME